MNREIELHMSEVEALCRRYGVRRLELFGSATGDGFHPAKSDIDFLVEFDDPELPGYADRYFGLMESLQELFGRPIDLVVDRAIRNPYFREAVERTKQLLYAA
jgi:predicted nucleotidyltransferase